MKKQIFAAFILPFRIPVLIVVSRTLTWDLNPILPRDSVVSGNTYCAAFQASRQ
jgi:hypothetical protein